MTPDVSISFVNWNTRELLLACLRALPAATADLSVEIIVVDNASSDGSVEAIAREFPSVHILRNDRNRGFAAANNQAVRIASGRYVLLLNTDTLPRPESLKRLVEFADAHPRAGMVGALLLNPDGSFQASYADFPSLFGETLLLLRLAHRLLRPTFPNYGPHDSQIARRCDWVQGACLLARREALADCGPMDEGYFMYTEETDWCAECWKAGWEVWYTPDAAIVHYGGRSAARQPAAKRRQLYLSKARFFRKQRGVVASALFQIILQTTSALKLVYWIVASGLRTGERRATARTNVHAYLTVLGFTRG
jgi:hypothetical protein